jgi:hypothetical protein
LLERDEVTLMFIKVVYSIINRNEVRHFSISTNHYTIEYKPGEWCQAHLPGSLLFVFSNLFMALNYHRKPRIEIPYQGITFWHCEAIGTTKLPMIKDPPNHLLVNYWRGPKTYDWIQSLPWLYRFKDQPLGVVCARQVRLINMVTSEEMAEIPTIFLDR